MKYWWAYGGIVLLLAAIFVGVLMMHREMQNTIVLNGNTIHVTLASTDAAREQGLSGRTGLGENEGMLFVFDQPGDYRFWMKDMLFSIDILWMDATGKIVSIAPSVSPDTYPISIDPHADASYVLELPAGYAAKHDIVVGDQARI